MTPADIKANKGPFMTTAWQVRKNGIAERVARRAELNRAKTLLRKETAKPKSQTKKEIRSAQRLVKKVEAKRARSLKFKNKKK